MPMTPSGRVPERKAGDYETVLVCLGRPRCARGAAARQQAQRDKDCDMCKREYQWVENQRQ